MATFRVGQRVRIVSCFGGPAQRFVGMETRITGTTEVLTGFRRFHWVPGYAVAVDDGSWGFTAEQLEPLTDPGEKPLTAADVLGLPESDLQDFRIRSPLHVSEPEVVTRGDV